MPFPYGPGTGQGLRAVLMQILDAAGQLPNMAMGPHAGMMNEGLEEFTGGGARGDDVMGAMPMLPPMGKLAGMAGRLRQGGRAYQGTSPIAGSQGVPHTSPLPNPRQPQPAPGSGGAPPSGGGYADDAAGLMRGDIPLEKPRLGADFKAMDDLGPMAEAPIDRSARMSPGPKYGAGYADDAAYAQRGELMGPGTPNPSMGMNNPEYVMNIMDEFDAMHRAGQIPYEQAVDAMVAKYGDWILGII